MSREREGKRKRGNEDMIVLKKGLQSFEDGFYSSMKDIYLYFAVPTSGGLRENGGNTRVGEKKKREREVEKKGHKNMAVLKEGF